MNKERRERLRDVISILEEASSSLSDVIADEEDALYALPEGLQYSERGEKMQGYIDLMQEGISKIDNVSSYIETEIINKK